MMGVHQVSICLFCVWLISLDMAPLEFATVVACVPESAPEGRHSALCV